MPQLGVNGKEACPVLDADDETAKNSRLKLSALTANVFQEGLQLLKIETLERM
jgi:arginyl-tRNA synthetase